MSNEIKDIPPQELERIQLTAERVAENDPDLTEMSMGIYIDGYQNGAKAEYLRHLSPSSKPEGGLGWVRVSEHLPLHKAHWNTGKFGDHDNDFPVRMNGRYSMANIFDQAAPNSPNTMFMLSFDGRDHYEDEFSEIEWLDESIHSSESK